MMIVIIICLLVLIPVNGQLAFIWLNHQQYSCAQNTRNYREAVRHQYLCIFVATWTCVRDANVYTSSSVISLDYFCGFIDGQNARQSLTTWNIYLGPNIHVHFNKFSLFTNYWYCDAEYLRVTSKDNISTFCGNRLPWIYDASAFSISIILSVQRFGSTYNQIELQYYAAYASDYQHFIVFMESYSILNTHLYDIGQNNHESFHYISDGKLNIVIFTVDNMCSNLQIVCYDGPGIKSPTLHFSCHQSECKCVSSTFQMICKVSKIGVGCSTLPQLNYHAERANEKEFKRMIIKESDSLYYFTLHVNETVDRGTMKYLYIYHFNFGIYQTRLTVRTARISFPYMLYEGHSCMYGGIYILKNITDRSKYVPDTPFSSNVSEALSLCTPSNGIDNHVIVPGFHFAILIIHYKEYSMPTITFEAEIEHLIPPAPPLNLSATSNKSKNVTILYVMASQRYELYLHSIILDLRKLQYIFITFQQGVKATTIFDPGKNVLCIYYTVVYPPRMSNIRGLYEREVLNRAFTKYSIILSISINASSCNPFIIPMWSLAMEFLTMDESKFKGINTTSTELLPDLVWSKMYVLQKEHHVAPFWYMIHMIKPVDVPAYAIWRVRMDVCHAVSDVSLEVPTDIYLSTSVYKWNHHNTTYNVYMAFDVAINVLFTFDDIIPRENCQVLFLAWFKRHFVYDDRSIQHVAGQMPEQKFFTFHNVR